MNIKKESIVVNGTLKTPQIQINEEDMFGLHNIASFETAIKGVPVWIAQIQSVSITSSISEGKVNYSANFVISFNYITNTVENAGEYMQEYCGEVELDLIIVLNDGRRLNVEGVIANVMYFDNNLETVESTLEKLKSNYGDNSSTIWEVEKNMIQFL